MGNSTSNILGLDKKHDIYANAFLIYCTFPLLFISLLTCLDAPYGKFEWSYTKFLMFPGKISWIIMEVVSPLTLLYTIFSSSLSLKIIQILLISLWLIHYTNRVFIYVVRAPRIAPIHLLTILCGMTFNFFNAFTNTYWIIELGKYTRDDFHGFWIYLRVAIGIIIFLTGMVINISHDNILFSLRKKAALKSNIKTPFEKTQNQHYSIPYGGYFRYVSCPSYFGEFIEWIGFSIAAWWSPPALVFVLATAANLFPRALKTHQWYLNKFKENYPLDRKAIVPFFL
ncbi:hypothetical protein G9A89_010094 [Geosiphon pyriformis]|nr:hypothetical protein G9A89_010094 [Geosiphon pyriformis]